MMKGRKKDSETQKSNI